MKCCSTVLVSLLVCCAQAMGRNLVRNGDFSQGTSHGPCPHWSIQSWGPPLGKAVVDRREHVSGDASLSLRHDSAEQQTFYVQDVTLEKGQRYRIGYYVKGADIRGTAAFCGAAVYLLDQGNALFSMGTGLYRHGTGTFDWRRVEHEFSTDGLQSQRASLVLALREVTGSVWYDDVTLEKVTPKTGDLTTHLYPVDLQKQSYHLCRDFPAALLLDLTIDPKLMPGGKLDMVLELPAEVEYVGSGPLLPWYDDAKRLVFQQDRSRQEDCKRDGKAYVRHVISFCTGFAGKLGKTHAWENYNRIYLRLRGGEGHVGRAYWHLRSRVRTFPERSFSIHGLPPLTLPDRPCQRFQLCLARPWNMNAPGGISREYVRLWTSLQAKPWVQQPYYVSSYPAEEASLLYGKFHYSDHLPSSRSMPWLGSLYNAVSNNRFPGKLPPSIKPDGTAIPVSVSPWYLIEDPEHLIWGTLFDEYARNIRKNPHIKAISIDYEPGSMTHCFSLESRRRFADYARLGRVPEPQEILNRHKGKWLAYRVDQHTQIIRRLSEAMKAKLPDIQFWVISDPLNLGGQPVAEWCGVDVRALDPYVAMHQDMPYFAGLSFFETMKLNIRTLKKPCFPLIDPSENSSMYYDRYTPKTVLQNVVAVAALGGYGIGFWPCDVFDGRYLHAIRDAYAAVAHAEQAFARPPLPAGSCEFQCENVMRIQATGEDGRKVPLSLPALDRKIRMLHHRLGQEEFLTVFNFSQKHDALLRLRLPQAEQGHYAVCDMLTQTCLAEQGRPLSGASLRQGFLLEVPAEGTVLLKLTPASGKEALAGKRIVEQRELRERLRDAKRKAQAGNRLKPYRSASSSAYWGVLPKGDTAMLFLTHGKGRIGISALENGNVCSWQPSGDAENDVLAPRLEGFLGKFFLNSQSQLPGPCPFDLSEIREDRGRPVLKMSYVVPDFDNASVVTNPLKNLRIDKTIMLEGQGRRIQLSFSFHNPGRRPMRLSFRVNNFPKPGNRFAGGNALCPITEVFFGDLPFRPGQGASERLFLLEGEEAEELRENVIFRRLKKERISSRQVRIAAGKGLKETLSMVPDAQTAGFYSWANIDAYTLEPISKELTILPGKTVTWSCAYELAP